AKSQEYRINQRGALPIYDGRYDALHPTSTVGPPVDLYYSGFAKFRDDLNDSNNHPPPEFVCGVAKLMAAAAGIYTDEDAFSSAVFSLLQVLLDAQCITIKNQDKTSADFVLYFERAILLLCELKREVGEGGCDASTQAILSTLRYWTQTDNEVASRVNCCPTYVVAFGGPWLAIMGAVVTSRCIAQRLTDFMWLAPQDCLLNRDHVHKVARTLFSLKNALAALRQQRPPHSATSPPEISDARFFPHPTSYPRAGQRIRFDYVAAMEKDPSCVTFHCQVIDTKEDIVVKFVSSYGKEAHEFLGRLLCAPQLFYCGPIDESRCSYGGMQMVVMEFIPGQTLSLAQATGSIIADNVPQVLTEVLTALHDEGFVFGDLRGPNIILPDDRSRSVVLLDFDWAGKAGEARYPINLSSGVKWPPDAQGLGKITSSHDDYMLRQIIEEYCL
ncbi:hypothetical protein B0H16DRAFT_1333673, partial [Mycena metata]